MKITKDTLDRLIAERDEAIQTARICNSRTLIYQLRHDTELQHLKDALHAVYNLYPQVEQIIDAELEKIRSAEFAKLIEGGKQ